MFIDRLEPTRRPSLPVVGTHRWRSLLFLHWTVPEDVLRPLVPDGLSLDLHDGVAYVGLVPFVMREIRSKFWPRKLGFNFLETNVRTYVHCNGRPGVYFLSLDADSRPAVWGARRCWGLPYHFSNIAMSQEGESVHYNVRRSTGRAAMNVVYEPGEWLGPSPAGSLEHFLIERYLLFVSRRGRILAGHVHHEPYPVQTARVLEIDDSLLQAAGIKGVSGPPAYAHYSAGVDVDIFGLQPA